MGISHIDVHQSGRECTIDGFGAFDCGDVDITYTERHDTQAKDATVENADSKTEGIDAGTAIESACTTKEHGVGISELGTLDSAKTGDI
jgi:hypothetical protein